MHVLLTGASSFIGGHLAQSLVHNGFFVTATYRRVNHIIERLRRRERDIDYVALDLADPGAFARLPSRIDAVIHVAGISPGPGTTIDDTIACNVTGARNIVRYATSAQAARLIYMSTLSVHGRIVSNVVDENAPIHDSDLYGASKYFAERLIATSARELAAVALRLPGVLGYGAHRAWLPTLLQRIRRSEAIEFYNPDALFNNAAHVADLAAFCGELLRRPWEGFHAMPVGAAGHITVHDAVTRMMAAAGSAVPTSVSPTPRPAFTISSDFAVRGFGYRPMEIGAMIERYVADEMSRDRSN